MRLLIATPTQSLWCPEYGNSLMWVGMDLVVSDNGVDQVTHNWVDGTLLSQVRQDLAEHAQKIGATHILWTDADMKFGPGNVNKLLAHSEKDVVGTNYIRRRPPHNPVAIDAKGGYLAPKARGLEKVSYTGMGLMLTKTSVFERLPKPWFMQPYAEELGHTIGEDVWFCKLCKDHGIDVWVDHEASIGVGHVSKDVLSIEIDEKPKLQLVN